jgi:hypothetical protein
VASRKVPFGSKFREISIFIVIFGHVVFHKFASPDREKIITPINTRTTQTLIKSVVPLIGASGISSCRAPSLALGDVDGPAIETAVPNPPFPVGV